MWWVVRCWCLFFRPNKAAIIFDRNTIFLILRWQWHDLFSVWERYILAVSFCSLFRDRQIFISDLVGGSGV